MTPRHLTPRHTPRQKILFFAQFLLVPPFFPTLSPAIQFPSETYLKLNIHLNRIFTIFLSHSKLFEVSFIVKQTISLYFHILPKYSGSRCHYYFFNASDTHIIIQCSPRCHSPPNTTTSTIISKRTYLRYNTYISTNLPSAPCPHLSLPRKHSYAKSFYSKTLSKLLAST